MDLLPRLLAKPISQRNGETAFGRAEYFRRQVYSTFWFETGVARQVDLYPDNLMFETDYPHPTSLSPGAGSYAKAPQQVIRDNLADLTEEQRRKVLHETAARVYRLGS